MRQALMVPGSDNVNLYGQRILASALAKDLYDNFDTGVPVSVGHDTLRLVGWTYPLALHFEPGSTRAVGIWTFPETEEEREEIFIQRRLHYERIIAERSHEFDVLSNLLADHMLENEYKVPAECVSYAKENLARDVFPEIFATEDDDGLVDIDLLEILSSGVFKVGDLALFAHPYLRRSLYRLNTLNYPFLEVLQSLQNQQNLGVKIALDPDMVGLASSYKPRVELQYWYGPEFDDELSKIPVGITRHEATETDRHFAGISRTEFWWQSRDNQHILEAEELRDRPTASENTKQFGCRYVHSIVDEEDGTIFHFDGAIRTYSEDEMIERLDLNLMRAGRHTIYTKLWRVDGSLPTPVWKSLLHNYFRDNPLVGEYLEGKLEAEAVDISGQKDSDLDINLVPYSMSSGTGVRMALSFQPLFEATTSSCFAEIDTQITQGDKSWQVVESEVLELKKVLNRQGYDLTLPDNIYYISYKDFYTNFTPIHHSNLDHFVTTLHAVQTLIDIWVERGEDRVVCFTLSYPIGERQALFSYLGHINDLTVWLSNPLAVPPSTEVELFDWTNEVAEYLRTSEIVSEFDKPALMETLTYRGVLEIRRIVIEEAEFAENDQGLGMLLKLPEVLATNKQILGKSVGPSIGYIILDSMCTKCGEKYEDCECSKLLDEDVAREVIEAWPFAFLTDRPFPGLAIL